MLYFPTPNDSSNHNRIVRSCVVAFVGQILTYPDPPLLTQSNFWSKMACTYVLRIEVFYVQLAPLGGILGPLKSVLALFLLFRQSFLKRQFLAPSGALIAIPTYY